MLRRNKASRGWIEVNAKTRRAVRESNHLLQLPTSCLFPLEIEETIRNKSTDKLSLITKEKIYSELGH